MALFTHQYATNAPAEVNPASDYFSAIAICRNHVARQNKYEGQVMSDAYRQMERDGFRFLGHVFVPGKQPTSVVMVKPAAVAVEANAEAYGTAFDSFSVFALRDTDLFRVQFSYAWDNNFSPRVIAGDVKQADLVAHLKSLTDDAELHAWLDTQLFR